MLRRGERVTAIKLREKIDKINRALGRPVDGWTKTDDGYVANIGHICLCGANDGYQLEQHVAENGGTRILSSRMTGREMYHFLSGMEQFHGLLNGEERLTP